MKKLRKAVFTLAVGLCALMITENTMAIPAFNKMLSHKQSNGKTISYFIYGDEYVTWAKTLDGYTIVTDKNGDWVYAVTDKNGDMQPSQVIAADEHQRTATEKKFLDTLNKNIFYSLQQLQKPIQKRAALAAYNKKTPVKSFTTTNPKFIVILVNYTDVTFSSTNANLFKHQIQDSAYTAGGYTGSVRDYFADNSFNTINPQFDVYGPVTLPHNRNYYCQNQNNNAWQMARDAVKIIDTMYNVDFSVYDNDGDGIIDLVHIIYAGFGSNTTGNMDDAVWPHMYYFQTTTTLDGKQFGKYACSSETNKNYYGSETKDAIGAVCHEMGHAFGLPDMYDTDYQGYGTQAVHPGVWDVMASGSYNNDSKTPPYYSMVERDMLGWGNIINLTPGEHKLYPLADSNSAYKIHLDANEYLMLEYRNHDKWDAYIPGTGMLVWHADTSQFINWESTNSVNADPNDRGYYIECAGNESALESQSTPYPGSLNVTDIPHFALTDGTEIDGNIYNIHYENGTSSPIIFNYNPQLPITFTSSVSDITTTSAVISGTFASEETISDRVLQYKKASDASYTTINITSDSFSQSLSNLEINTTYNYRLGGKTDTSTYYSSTKKFHTLCNEGAVTEFPWVEGFENGIDCWSVESSSDANWIANTSALGGYAEPYEGEAVAEFTFTQSYWTESSARLISPVLDLSGVQSPILSFSYILYSGASSPLRVYYRTSETDSWQSLKTYNNPNNPNNVNWKKDSIMLPSQSSTYQISFLARDNYGYGASIDNVIIKSNTSSLSDAEGNVSFSLQVMPNPSADNATLHINGLQDDAVITVYDALGRIVENIKADANQKTVNLNSSAYENGVYTIKLTSKDKVCSEKFIKQ